MGATDTDLPRYRYAFSPDGRIALVTDTGRSPLPIECRLDATHMWRSLGASVPADLADLADVARAVYAADRLSRRRSQVDIGRWARRIEVEVPVRDPSRWNNPALIAALVELLWDFTEDEWDFSFVPHLGAARPTEIQPGLVPAFPDATVTAALFSGGLDSLAGFLRDRIAHPVDGTILLSVRTNPRLAALQGRIAGAIKDTLGSAVVPISIPFGFQRHGRAYDEDESSQRSRGFVFLALGAVAALMAGAEGLTVYENGVGAINLPYTAAQFGAQHTRATAPQVLVSMRDFVARATGRPFATRLPFLLQTKGEICVSLHTLDRKDLAAETVSCDSFPLRMAGVTHCGVCTSCLLRRQSLHAAGLAAVDRLTAYRWDITDPSASIPAEKMLPLRMVRAQAQALIRDLSADDPWLALSHRYPALRATASAAPELGIAPEAVEDRIVALYRRHCDEWSACPVRVPYGAHALVA